MKIQDNSIFIDNSIVMQIDKQFCRAKTYKYNFDCRIAEVGFEHLYLELSYVSDIDEAHAWTAINFAKVQNCWVKQVKARKKGKK